MVNEKEEAMRVNTADLCDRYAAEIQVAEPLFQDYGHVGAFFGAIATVQVYEDNVLVRQVLETPGNGRVLVVDGGGSTRCALVGDMLASLGHQHGWAGMVIYGCIRDRIAVGNVAIGMKALNTNPLRSHKEGGGRCDLPVTFAGVTFIPGHYVYADEDGLIVAPRALP
jgi:regulator of ribonuclease activity A